MKQMSKPRIGARLKISTPADDWLDSSGKLSALLTSSVALSIHSGLSRFCVSKNMMRNSFHTERSQFAARSPCFADVPSSNRRARFCLP